MPNSPNCAIVTTPFSNVRSALSRISHDTTIAFFLARLLINRKKHSRVSFSKYSSGSGAFAILIIQLRRFGLNSPPVFTRLENLRFSRERCRREIRRRASHVDKTHQHLNIGCFKHYDAWPLFRKLAPRNYTEK
ncbi:hypothetical protein TcasGA2_TC008988 [Tribolium castaneum]|uniref:Uncharacterized protein n=1 Tax=Tribolium castaneum TaxID=7070 RepID=D6WQ17_TRICA|nr:hypothetical protein TcasGA2_TC008988 [Tribolium castaneum]